MKKDLIVQIEADLKDLSLDLWELREGKSLAPEENDPLRRKIQAIHQRIDANTKQLEQSLDK